jgi:uncharacterized protein
MTKAEILTQLTTAVTSTMTRPNILLVTKGHPFSRGPFFELFDELDVDYTHVEQPAACHLLQKDFMSDYDCVVFYDMPGINFLPGGPDFLEPTSEFKSQFLDLLASGKGMLFLHHAIAGWPKWPEYAEIVGGRFLYLPSTLRGKDVLDSGYRHHTTHEVTILEPLHPILEGLPPSFSIEDELYLFEVFEEDVIPLLRSNFDFTSDNFYSAAKVVKEGKRNSNQDWAHPPGSNLIGWIKHYANSPITYLQSGDDPITWENKHFKKLLKNAINWTASSAALTWAGKQ